jgi:hypothetical protein
MRERRNRAERLRTAVELLPRHTREAMLRGIATNYIVVGAYADRNGGICPMLAAHRNGGRTSFASFARAWDDFTRARRPRRATRREVRALRTYLEMSLLAEDAPAESIAALADGIRSERRHRAERAAAREPQPPRFAPEIRIRRRGRRRVETQLDVLEATAGAAAEQLAEQQAADALNAPRASRPPHRAG